MAVPQIDLLPPPALPTDPEDVFDAKVGASLTAEQAMVPQINTSLTWIDQQAAAVDGYRQAAATSATNAAASATAANTSKNAAATSATQATTNGAAQVTLAAAQVTLAQQAATAAQSAAQAAGAAAGLPGGRVPFTVLQINAAGNVSWGDGLIDKSAAVPGQALMLGSGKTPQWAFPGQQVGDVLLSCRDPGALYLPANGSIRLQSAYPALFAKLGLIGGIIGTAWADYDYGGVAGYGIAASLAGTVISVLSTTQVRRSTDRGVTWSNITIPAFTSGNPSGISTDGAGTWIVTSGSTGPTFQCLRSIDDGLTWQLVTMPSPSGSGGSWSKAIYCGNGVWLASSNYSTTLARSVNNGASWATVSHGYPVTQVLSVASNNAGTVLITGYDGTNSTVRKSTDYGATFSSFLTLSGQSGCISTDGQGTWIVGLGGTGALRSFDDAATAASFTTLTVTGGVANNTDIMFVNGLVLYMFNGSGAKVVIQSSNGSYSSQSSAANVTGRFSNAGNGVLFAGSATAGRISRSVPQFGYDTATQFALPNVQVAIGTSAYIKAKELT